MKALLLLTFFVSLAEIHAGSLVKRVEVDDRIIARWTNNLYYPGKVVETENGLVHVLFDDGDKITHSIRDISAIIPDQEPGQVQMGQHVLATWKGGHKYYIGFISDKDSNNRFKVTFDDNDEDFYLAEQLRIFPDQYSVHKVGARVFARWTNGLYYRGFVISVTSTTVFIRYDDGDTITLLKVDRTAVILDKLPCYSDIHPGQRVIGYWPGRTRYYPGVVTVKTDTGSNYCYQKAVYNVLFDDGDRRVQDFHQIRIIDDRVIARWTNNLYYPGKVAAIENKLVHVSFDDGDKISHSIQDISAVIPDEEPSQVQIGQHVLATWKGGHKYYIGYVSDKDSNNRFKVTFDDNDEDFYLAEQLIIFPDQYSVHEVGARVFARWTNGLYYRGFVASAISTTVFIRYDDGDTITLHKTDCKAVILDKLPCYSDIHPGQRVIGYWPGRTRYYPGVVTAKKDTGRTDCYQKAVYSVLFDDGDRRVQDFHQIRIISCKA